MLEHPDITRACDLGGEYYDEIPDIFGNWQGTGELKEYEKLLEDLEVDFDEKVGVE